MAGGEPGRADHPERPADADVVDVVPDEAGVGAGLSVAAERAVDDARVSAAYGFVVDAEALDDARPEALDHDVRLLRHLQESLLGARLLQIQADGALVAVERPERLRTLAHAHLHAAPGAGRFFDDDDVRAEVAEKHRAVRPWRLAGKIEDADSFEGHHGRAPSYWSFLLAVSNHTGRR